MLAATFDIGTTAVKAVVVNENGEAVFTGSSVIHTIETENFKEQDPDEWYEAFCGLSKELFEIIPAAEIGAVIFSGQMRDVIPVGADGKALGNAILYSDGRADEQARAIIREAAKRNVVPLGDAYIAEITGNHFDGSMPLAKILWLKENKPEIYEKTACFLISSKDYVITRLTGVFAGDMTACSTAGAMDLDRKEWSEELIEAAGLDRDRFPKLFCAHECVGTVTEAGALESGYAVGTKVYAGTGDAGATTLASGILSPGEYNINLGTSGWVAAVSDRRMESEGGGFNLAAMQKDLLINVVPFLNGGNVHRLIAKILSRDPDGTPDFEYISELLEQAEPGSHGLFFLPYVTGERFPIMDSSVRGSFLGLSQETTAADLAQSVLEGVAFSIRQGLERFDQPAKKVTLIGGGARERRWCRILSNVMGQKIFVYKDPDLLPALAIASAVFVAEGVIPDYQAFISTLESRGHCDAVEPDPEISARYHGIYQRYKGIYPLVREFYSEKY